jgi:hypothetical protein
VLGACVEPVGSTHWLVVLKCGGAEGSGVNHRLVCDRVSELNEVADRLTAAASRR